MTRLSTLAPVRRHFRALTEAFVPSAAALDEAGWLEAEAIVDEALQRRPEGIRRQVVLFVRILNLVAGLRYGRGLIRAGPVRLRSLLASLERAPVLLLRRGVWGLRTLAYMGYYGQDGVRRWVGYAAAAGGWDALGRDAGAWSHRAGAGRPEDTTLTAGDGTPHDVERPS